MDKILINELRSTLEKVDKPLTFMEVCGTHTMEIGKLSLRSYLGDKINLISGPGCPVCVTESIYIDYLYSLAIKRNISIITYGDMIRVPGSSPEISLEKARALGGDIRIVYSAIDAINLVLKEKHKDFVFVAIGFETTLPPTCILLSEIIERNINNLYILSLHKRVQPVMEKLLIDKEVKIDGFLLPGNVGVLIGEEGFNFINNFNSLGVIVGFKDDEIINGITILIKKALNKERGVFNGYKTFVNKEGNLIAKEFLNKYFNEDSSLWRGIGNIDKSGLSLKEEFKVYNIEEKFGIKDEIKALDIKEKKFNCKCGEVLKGKIKPCECGLFKNICTPSFPIGPCMVSSEGTCAAYFKYEGL